LAERHSSTEDSPIPVNEPLLAGNERRYLLECLDTGWISSEGPFVERFERAFAARIGRKFGVAVSSGTAALEVAVQALNLGPGDEVILPAFTIISCAAAVVRAGAVPILVDSDPQTWNMAVDQLGDKITPRTRAIMPVHIYGLPVDMRPVLDLAGKHNLAIIEDAAEAHGQTCRGRPCGSFGELSIFSFYPNKLVTTGEGGMILTDDPGLAETCRGLRNLCFQPSRRFVHERLGYNYRMTCLQAALGLAQLERLDSFILRKRRMGARYAELLGAIAGLQLQLTATAYADNLYWVFGLLLDDSIPDDARSLMGKLAERGIGTRPFFWPIHQQPVFQTMGLFAGESYPVAERLARRGLYLPSGLALTDPQIRRVAAALADCLP
jgi:perosamine synthetase